MSDEPCLHCAVWALLKSREAPHPDDDPIAALTNVLGDFIAHHSGEDRVAVAERIEAGLARTVRVKDQRRLAEAAAPVRH